MASITLPETTELSGVEDDLTALCSSIDRLMDDKGLPGKQAIVRRLILNMTKQLPDPEVEIPEIPASPPRQSRSMSFPAGGSGLYQLVEDVDAMEIRNQLNARLGQLHAMLTVTYGEGSETFGNWSDEIQENYMWAAAMIAGECEELAHYL